MVLRTKLLTNYCDSRELEWILPKVRLLTTEDGISCQTEIGNVNKDYEEKADMLCIGQQCVDIAEPVNDELPERPIIEY